MTTYLLIALGLLQVLDAITTLYVLRKGAGVEGNPVARKLMAFFGPELATVLIKASIAIVIWTLRDHFEQWHWIVMIGFYLFVIGNNMRFVKKAMGK